MLGIVKTRLGRTGAWIGSTVLVIWGVFSNGNNFLNSIRNGVTNTNFMAQVGSGAVSWAENTDKIKPNDIAEKQMQAIREEKGCKFNSQEWDEGSGRLEFDPDTNTYSMPAGVNKSTIRYEKSVSSESTTRFVFTPQTNLINTVILYHDLIEIVVGDGDRYGTTFKANTGSKMEQIGERIITRGGMKVGNDIAVTIALKPLPRGDFEAQISIEYTKDDGTQNKVSEERAFAIPSTFENTEEPIRISVGLGEALTSSVFKCFKVADIADQHLATR